MFARLIPPNTLLTRALGIPHPAPRWTKSTWFTRPILVISFAGAPQRTAGPPRVQASRAIPGLGTAVADASVLHMNQGRVATGSLAVDNDADYRSAGVRKQVPIMSSILVIAFACSRQASPPGSSTDVPQTTLTPPPSTGSTSAVVTVSKPANPDILLTRALDVTSLVAVRVEVDLVSDDRIRTIKFEELARAHHLPLLGFRQQEVTQVHVRLVDAQGTTTPYGPFEVVTLSLPEDFPVLDTLVHDVDRVAPGYLAFDATVVEDSRYIVLDDALQPIWVYQNVDSGLDGRVGPDGTWWIQGARGGALHLTWLGEVLQQWGGTPLATGIQTPLDIGELHHELFPDGQGGLFSLSAVATAVPAYPTNYDEPTVLGGPATLRDSTIVHIDSLGGVLSEFRLGDVLDTTRITFDSITPTEGYLLDWSHANALCLSEAGGYTVSVRNQDAIVGLAPDGSLNWILGDAAGHTGMQADALLETLTEGLPPYHMHGGCWEEDGSYVLFDNSNAGHTPYSNNPHPDWTGKSRAVAYAVDPDAGTYEELWSLDETFVGKLFVEARGDADLLPNGGVLVDYGTVKKEPNTNHKDEGWGDSTFHIVEFGSTQNGDVVLQIRARSDRTTNEQGFVSYRAERLPALYPAEGLIRATESLVTF